MSRYIFRYHEYPEKVENPYVDYDHHHYFPVGRKDKDRKLYKRKVNHHTLYLPLPRDRTHPRMVIGPRVPGYPVENGGKGTLKAHYREMPATRESITARDRRWEDESNHNEDTCLKKSSKHNPSMLYDKLHCPQGNDHIQPSKSDTLDYPWTIVNYRPVKQDLGNDRMPEISSRTGAPVTPTVAASEFSTQRLHDARMERMMRLTESYEPNQRLPNSRSPRNDNNADRPQRMLHTSENYEPNRRLPNSPRTDNNGDRPQRTLHTSENFEPIKSRYPNYPRSHVSYHELDEYGERRIYPKRRSKSYVNGYRSRELPTAEGYVPPAPPRAQSQNYVVRPPIVLQDSVPEYAVHGVPQEDPVLEPPPAKEDKVTNARGTYVIKEPEPLPMVREIKDDDVQPGDSVSNVAEPEYRAQSHLSLDGGYRPAHRAPAHHADQHLKSIREEHPAEAPSTPRAGLRPSQHKRIYRGHYYDRGNGKTYFYNIDFGKRSVVSERRPNG